MLLTIRTTHPPATDLGFLLHKHPEHVHTREFPFGKATVFYPEATEDSCTAAILLDVDPVGIVRGRVGKGGAEDQYVNDRPYVASSLLSVVLSRWFNSALAGRCERKPELVATPLPLEARLAAVPCRGGEGFLRALFEPLGYEVPATRHELDESMPALGPSRLFTVTLRATRRLSQLLTHLYVLIPVLDDQKHYWVGDDEIEKLLRHGEGWLDKHPARDAIVSRYLVHQPGLVRDAIARLTAEEHPEEETTAAQKDEQEALIERTIGLHERRLDAVFEVLKASGASRVLDLGCGEGKLLRRLLADQQFAEDPATFETYEIVGLVPDTKYSSLREPPRPIAFLPGDPTPDPRTLTDFMVGSALPAGQLQTALKQTLASRSPLLGVDVQVYDEMIRRRLGPERLMGVLSAFFGGLSLLVAAVGLYGVMSYLVTQRTNELGVRVALGASRGHVIGLVLREAAILAGSGLALGSALALAGADAARSLVFGVGPRDVLPIAMACVLLGTVALLASLVPAWRAARVEPLTALHTQ